MAYQIEPGESPSLGLRRVFAEQVAAAQAHLDRPAGEVHAAIHDARRAMRRARAAQALLRPRLDRARWTACSASLRSAGTLLSPLRDAQSVVEAIEAHLVQAGVALDEAARSRLLRSLRSRRDRIVGAGGPALDSARRWVARAADEGPGPLEGFDHQALARGLAAGRRRLDRALHDALAAPSDGAAWHRLRQRARVHWLQLELVSNAWPVVLGALAAEAKRLSQSLGEERDLQLLDAWLSRRRAVMPGGRPLPAVRADVIALRASLRERALRIARRIASEPPRRFARRVAALRVLVGGTDGG